MKFTRHLSAALLAGTVMMFSATAQAQITTSPGENTTTTPGSTTLDTANDMSGTRPNSNADMGPADLNPDVNINNNVPPAQNTVTQPQSTTRIEVQNQAPANNVPAPAPNIDIDMPDMPDINVTTPNTAADSGTNERVTERSERVIINDDNDADATNNNILFMAIFGVLAIFLVAVIAMVLSRRRTIDQF